MAKSSPSLSLFRPRLDYYWIMVLAFKIEIVIAMLVLIVVATKYLDHQSRNREGRL
jgi:hypothetical protein